MGVRRRTLCLLLPLTLLAALSAAGRWAAAAEPGAPDIGAAYAAPLPPPAGPLSVFHLGHSLVGRDMPAMLAQLAGPGHRYDSQLGWGASLRAHWEETVPIAGFAAENDHPRARPAKEAVGSGNYDAVVLTEMVDLADAIAYHDSADYFARWTALARAARPAPRIYLYETWHRLDDAEGWLARLDADLDRYWEAVFIRPDLARRGDAPPLYVIPAGQVMARFVRAIEARGGIGEIERREDLFARRPDGTRDPIHLNDKGAYLVALTHYAVLYQRSPLGLPNALIRADGRPAAAPEAEAAQLMQQVVWEVVTSYPKTGVQP